MAKQAFSFNSNAKYTGRFNQKTIDLVHQKIVVKGNEGFGVQFPDILAKYVNPPLAGIAANDAWKAWMHSPFQWWQNQINFAVWCATAGSGVSFKDHLQASEGMMSSVYHFHLYYQVRRILAELKVALPTEQSFEMYNNRYDKQAYERLCIEFEVSPHADWRQKIDPRGLGGFVQYFKPSGKERMEMERQGQGPVFFSPHDSIHHSADISRAWTSFIPDEGRGFTQAGIVRLNDSIRTYVWAVLGAQAQTRARITGTGTAFDAQKQFLEGVEDAISAPVNLPSAIRRYQDVLQHAGSEVNYVYGIGLYMSPSDMLLRIGPAWGYNNEIVIATVSQSLGANTDVNTMVRKKPDFAPSPASPPKEPPTPSKEPPKASPREPDHHEEEKTALVVFGIGVGLAVIWFRRQ